MDLGIIIGLAVGLAGIIASVLIDGGNLPDFSVPSQMRLLMRAKRLEAMKVLENK